MKWLEVEDSPPRPVSPASQLMRGNPKPVSSAGIGCAQLLPNAVPIPSKLSRHTRARLPPKSTVTRSVSALPAKTTEPCVPATDSESVSGGHGVILQGTREVFPVVGDEYRT